MAFFCIEVRFEGIINPFAASTYLECRSYLEVSCRLSSVLGAMRAAKLMGCQHRRELLILGKHDADRRAAFALPRFSGARNFRVAHHRFGTALNLARFGHSIRAMELLTGRCPEA